MLNSKIQFIDGRPFLNIEGEAYSPLAYTTYFDECGKWTDFIEAGYKIFFVNISFTELPINNLTGFSPFRTGVFETEAPDYSEFEETVHRILTECPDAFIFPRIHISMPRKWVECNLYETVKTPNGGSRESLFSDKFRRDGAELLKEVLCHIKNSDYSHRIAGYQLCGGTTQEWIHHDLFGSFSEMGTKKFKEWALNKHGIKNVKPPQRDDLTSNIITNEVSLYYRFCSEKIAETIEHFAKTTKDFTDSKQVVGVFYGYNGFVRDPLWGLHGLGEIIGSPYIDFFSSPCCYDDNRNLGLDWGDMLPVDSVKLHGKLCFIECDIRTHLTKQMQASRPNEYPDNIMPLVNSEGKRTVWKGPDTLEHSISALRKAFAHQITKASGIWWFDMWGGWYHHPKIMDELNKMKRICDDVMNRSADNLPCAEVVLFIDEKAYANAPRNAPVTDAVNVIRVAMGNTGIPFDTYMVEDVSKVLNKYKAAVFTTPVPSEAGITAMELCKNNNIPCIVPTSDKYYYSTPELRDILVSAGIHCYNNGNNVIYCANGILAIHTKEAGAVQITLPKEYTIKPLLDDNFPQVKTSLINLDMTKHGTALFELNN